MIQGPTDYFNDLSQQMKAQVALTLNTIKEYKVYFQEQARTFSAWVASQYGPIKANIDAFMGWVIANIQAGSQYAWQNITYFIQHFPEYARNTAHWLYRTIVNGFKYGYETATKWIVGFLGAIKNIPTLVKSLAKHFLSLVKKSYFLGKALIQHGWEWFKSLIKESFALCKRVLQFIQSLPSLILEAVKKLYHFVKRAFSFGRWLGEKLFYVAKALLKAGWRFCKYIVKNFGAACRAVWQLFYDFITHIPRYLNQLKDALIVIGKILRTFAIEVLTALRSLAQIIVKNVFHAGKWVLKQALSKMTMGIGILYAISSALIDLAGSLLNSLVSNSIGLQLTQFALFENIKFGLSIGVTAFAFYHIARFSYYGITAFAGLVAARHLLPQQSAERERNRRPSPALVQNAGVEADIALEQPNQAMTPLYRQRVDAAAIPQDAYRPIPDLTSERAIAPAL